MIGETISHYLILEEIGTGGMGHVYKAEDQHLHRVVAIKTLRDEEIGQEEARARFLREARAACAINHPNIAAIYEIDEVERDGARLLFIAMEYAPGETLRDLIGSLKSQEAIEIILQIADALAEAHERGIVHRDIKPSNLIVSERKRVKILDFGIAKYAPPVEGATPELTHTETLYTKPGAVIGTFNYMSPEQATGAEVDARSDIFSLGVVFYEALTGRHPFGSEAPLAVLSAILYQEPPPLTSLNPEIAPALAEIVHRMIEKDRAQRYQSMREVLFDLDALRRGELRLLEATTYRDLEEANTSDGNEEQPGRAEGEKTRSVAVISFVNITQREEDEWLGAGIAETVTSDLKNIGGLTVIGRERVYDALTRLGLGSETELDEKVAARVGREIGANWMICGGYQRFGDQIRVTARTIEVLSGEVLKSVKVDGTMGEVFELQDKIVYQFAHDFELGLARTGRERIAQKETQVLPAYEAYSRGIAALATRTREGLAQAVKYFEEALTLDPNYVRAQIGLGSALGFEAEYLDRPESFARALENLQAAAAAHPQSADAEAALAILYTAMGRMEEAVASGERARALDPGSSEVNLALGRALMIGRGDFAAAAAYFEESIATDPGEGWAALQLAQCRAYLGDLARAEEAARVAIHAQVDQSLDRRSRRIVGAYARLGQILFLQGLDEEALAALTSEIEFLAATDHVLRERTMIEAQASLARVHQRRGEREQAAEEYTRARGAFAARLAAGADDPFTRYHLGLAAAALGEEERAFEHLAQAAALRPAYTLARLEIEPDFDHLRSDPRFAALKEKK